jgi:hypothetical protein
VPQTDSIQLVHYQSANLAAWTRLAVSARNHRVSLSSCHYLNAEVAAWTERAVPARTHRVSLFSCQSVLARKALEAQLFRLGVFHEGEIVAAHPTLDVQYKIRK